MPKRTPEGQMEAYEIAGGYVRGIERERDEARQERDQLQAAHNALSVKNAELAAELETAREDAREMRHLNALQGARLGEIRDVMLQGGQDGESVRRQLIALLAPIPLTACPGCGDRYRAVLEELATPVDVTARDEGWLHDHGDDSCEFDGCDAAELHYRIVTARQALEG